MICRFLVFFLAATVWAGSAAATEAPGFGLHSRSVTSVQKCLSALDPSEAAEVRRQYAKPYEECQRRTALKAKQAQQAGIEEARDAATPVTPRNFIRVQHPAAKEEDSSTKSKDKEAR